MTMRPQGVDPEALDQFLASAPDGLREWAEAQRAALEAPGLVELLDEDVVEEPAPPAKNPAARGVNKVLVALLAAAIVLIVQQWGRPATEPVGQAPHGDLSSAIPSAMPSFAPLDEQRVAQLHQQRTASPDALEPLRELARLHDEAGLWQQAAEYHQQVLDQAPEDLDAVLALGVFNFNQGELEEAEALWTKATQLAPDKPEGYYNLGFVHLAKEPADRGAAKAVWEQLIALDPDSELAKTAASHIARFDDGEG